MRDYVEYVGDFLLVGLGVQPCYGKANPVSVLLLSPTMTNGTVVRIHADNGGWGPYQLLRARGQ